MTIVDRFLRAADIGEYSQIYCNLNQPFVIHLTIYRYG